MTEPGHTDSLQAQTAHQTRLGRGVVRYGVAIISVALATLARMLLHPTLGTDFPFITYFLAVIFIAWYGGIGPALLTLTLGFLAAVYFFVPPQDSLAITGIPNLVGLALYLVVGVLSILISEASHRARRRAEATGLALRESQEWLSTTLRSIGDAVIATDREGRVTFMNLVAQTLTGWGLEEAQGKELKEVFKIINERTRTEVESPVIKVIKDGRVVGLANHTVLIARDGSEVPIEDSGAPIRDDAGNVVGVVLVFHDVTERRRAEQAARESEERFRTVAESASDAIIMIDETSTILFVNHAAEKIFGHTTGEMLGQSLTMLMPDYLRHVHRAAIKRYVETGEKHISWEAVELPGLHKSGQEVPLELSFAEFKRDGRHYFTGIARNIAERKQAAEALKESEERYRELFENANDIIYTLDLSGNLTSVNKAAERITGYGRDEILNKPITRIVTPQYLEMMQQMLERKVEGEELTSYELGVLAKDGRQLTLEVSSRLLYERGMPAGVQGIARDITERKRAEKEEVRLSAQIEGQRQHLRNLLANVPGVVWEAWGAPSAGSQQIDFVSDYVETLLGYSVEEWLATPNFWLSVVHPEDRERAAREAQAIFEGRKGGTSQFRWVAKDGHVVPVEAQSAVICDAEGSPVGMRGVTMDITERERAEEALRKSQAQMAGIIGSAMDAIVTIDSDQRVTLFNASAERMFRCRSEEVIGKPIDRFIPEPFRSVHREHVQAFGRTNVTKRTMGALGAIFGLRTDGEEFPIEASISQIQTDGQKFYTVILRDITERRQAEEERERLLTLEQAARAEAEMAADRTARLQRVTAALSEALTPAQVAVAVVEEGLSSLGAHAGTVVLVGDGGTELELAGTVGFTQELVDQWRRFPLSTPVPIAEAVRAGEVILLESFEEWMRRYPRIGPLRAVPGVQSLAAIPLIVEGRTFGAMGLSFAEPRKFTEKEIAFMLALARQCAQALERARLYDAERRSRAEAEASEQRYRYLADSMPQIVWTARPDGWLDYYNRRWFEYTGTTLEQTQGWGWQPVLHRDDVERNLRRWSKSVVTGQRYEIEYRVRRASDGTYRWHLARAVPMRDADGEIVKWFGTCTDIDDQKRAVEKLRFLSEASEMLASSLDYQATLTNLARLTVPHFADWCAIDMVGEDLSIRRLAVAHADPSKVELAWELDRRYPADISDDEGIPKVIRTKRSILYPEIPESLLESAARDPQHLGILRELGFKSAMVVPLIARGRTHGAITLVTAESGRRYGKSDLAFAEDLAHRAAMAVDNAHLYRSAQEASRSKDEFLATLSHELRTPLTPIIGWTHMMRSGKLSVPDISQGLSVIDKNSQALSRLINDLLDMTAILSGKMRIERAPLELDALVQEAVETVRGLAEKRSISIELDSCDGGGTPIVVPGDRTRLMQVFWNLLSNAVKFSGEGGYVRVVCKADDGEAQVEIEDQGLGIAPEFLPFVFERFRQADGSTTRAHGGLGIGLALVKSLVEAHGGTARAESAGVGRGSRFTITLPLFAQEQPASTRQLAAPPQAVPTQDADGARRVLIVEDAPDTLEMLQVVFETRGYQTMLCESADEALRAAPSMWFDIVVSDIGLPHIDGYELIRRLREIPHLRDVPAVALTGYAAPKDADAALAAGFDAHIPKPVDPAVLTGAIERLLTEKQRREAPGA